MLLLGVISLLPLFVVAQNTTAICTAPNFQWSFNSLNQSPCAIASIIGGTCVGVDLFIPALTNPSTSQYSGPPANATTSCKCSTVYYSLLSACAACQRGNFLNWSTYAQFCPEVFNEILKTPIPSNTRVPHYAYLLNITSQDRFDLQAAAAAGGPESTAGAPTPTSSSIPGTTESPTSVGGKKSDAGAIAGGVIGGVVGLFLIFGAIAWYLRRKRRPSAPSSEYSYGPMMSNATSGTITYPSTPAPKVYDPNDPSTFPSNMPAGPFTGLTTPSPDISRQHHYMSPNMTGYSSQTNHPQVVRPTYTGAPEL